MVILTKYQRLSVHQLESGQLPVAQSQQYITCKNVTRLSQRRPKEGSLLVLARTGGAISVKHTRAFSMKEACFPGGKDFIKTLSQNQGKSQVLSIHPSLACHLTQTVEGGECIQEETIDRVKGQRHRSARCSVSLGDYRSLPLTHTLLSH